MMAKHKRSPNAVPEETADSFALLDPAPAAQVPEAQVPEAQVAGVAASERTKTITVPMRESTAPRYSARHVEVQLDGDQAKTLTGIVEALDHSGARLKSGRRIASAADGLRWLLEELAIELP